MKDWIKDKNREIVLIDSHSLIHRAWHALPPLVTKKGEPSGALFGLSSTLLKILKERRPKYAAAFFDRPEETERRRGYSEYKAQREKADDDLVSQLIRARDIFEAFSISVFELPGYEADDLIGTAVNRWQGEAPIVIVTGDLDATQLVNDEKGVVVETFKKGISDLTVYDETAVKKRFGVRPDQIPDYKGLAGDSSDNIKGVPGVGPKTAEAVLNKFESVEDVYNNLEKCAPYDKKLKGFREEAEKSKKLATIEREAPITLPDIKDIEVKTDKERLKRIFIRYEFNRLAGRLEGGEGKDGSGKDFEQIKGGEEKLKIEKNIVWVTEDFKEEEGKRESKKIKVGFSLKEKIKKFGLRSPYFDLGVAFWLLDPDAGNYSSEYIFARFLKREYKQGEGGLQMAFREAWTRLEEGGLRRVFEEIEMPLLSVLVEMEKMGIGVDLKRLKILEERVLIKTEELKKKIQSLAGEEFNVNSPKQLGIVLFEKMGLSAKKIKKTAGGAISTSFDNLQKIKDEHEIVGFILEYREKFKVLSTYIQPIIELTDNNDRLHTNYLQTGTGTGRLSSEHPNLQNIPQESELAESLRDVFRPEVGYRFLSFDYSQMELRILASVAQDKIMLEAFRRGDDIHKITAATVLRVGEDEVTPKLRRLAKVLNFGIVYGMGVRAFAEAANISLSEAKDFKETYFNNFSAIKKWQENTIREARELGYVKTLSGRRRLIPEINSGSPMFKAQAERVAINMPIQGLGADIIKRAMSDSLNKLRENKIGKDEARILLTIHDDLLFEVKDKFVQRVADLVREAMENAFKLDIPLRVEVKEGESLGRMKKI